MNLADLLRWPWGVAAVGAMLLIVVLLISRRARRRRWIRVLGGGLAVLIMLAGAVTAWALPVMRLPNSDASGAHRTIGTQVIEWTTDRAEPFTADPVDRRRLLMQLWYPGQPTSTGRPMPYLGREAAESDAVADGIAAQFGVPRLIFGEAAAAHGNALVNLAPAALGSAPGSQRLPVVLFSPGLGGVRTQNTVLAEALASRGWLVVALDHPYDSAAIRYADGTVVRSRLAVGPDDAEADRTAGDWTRLRAADLRSALDRLGSLDADASTSFAGRIDLTKVAAVGHSLGGAAALQAATDDTRIGAVVNLDGFPRTRGAHPIAAPLLVMVAGRGTGNAANDSDYRTAVTAALRNGGPGSRGVTVPGAGHLTFTDAPLFLPPVPSLVGSGPRDRGPGLTRDAVVAFLDHALRGGPSPEATLAAIGTLERP